MPIDAAIVTLCFNHYQLTNTLLYGLHNYERANTKRVIVVDNASSDETQDGLAYWKTLWPAVEVVRQPYNLGFTLGANVGLKLATQGVKNDQLVFLISNDVQIRGKFIQQTADIVSSQKSLVGNTLVAHDSGWNKFGDKIYEYLDGSFLATTAGGWKDLGYFDPKYAPGDFDDVDASTTAKKLGYELRPLNNPHIFHACAGTTGYSPEREKITRRNQEYFFRKWTIK
jgi:GT2 family glycosyltransferase